MFSTAEKSTRSTINRQQQNAGATFFHQTGEPSFFNTTEQPTFFSAAIQPKLTVSSPDDPKEKEADAVAEQVMRMPEPAPMPVARKEKEEDTLQAKGEPVIHRQTADLTGKEKEEEIQLKVQHPVVTQIQCKEEEEPVQAKLCTGIQRNSCQPHTAGWPALAATSSNGIVNKKEKSIYDSDVVQLSGRGPPVPSIPFEQSLASSKGGGSAMPGETRQFMESRFNADFSGVRIHTGSYANNLNRQINAQAFTHGRDIYFNSGKYDPHTASGGLLLAHELTHTIQQGAGKSNTANNLSPTINRMPGTIYRSWLGNDIDISNKQGGHALSESSRAYFEDYYKTGLGDIRVHTDPEAVMLCRLKNRQAITEGKNILILPWVYNSDSEDAAKTLADQVSQSLKQRGIKTAEAGSDTDSGLLGIINKLLQEIKTQQNKPPAQKAVAAEKDIIASAKDKTGKGDKQKRTSGNKRGSKTGRKKGAGAEDAGAMPKAGKGKKKSPSKPSEDPAFQRVVKKSKTTANSQKQHDPATAKAGDAQKNAEAVPNEAESKAQNRKTNGMGTAAQQDDPFDAAAFKADLLKKIEAITPKNLEDATEFKENNRIGEVKNAMGDKVASEKEKTNGPVEKATKAPLQVSEADNKSPVPLPPTLKGNKPAGLGAKDAAPKPKFGEEISMEEQSRSLDEEMKANNVSEKQLQTSNEPSFASALKEKKNAQQDAKDKPQLYRKEEGLQLKEAQGAANGSAGNALNNMFASRDKNFSSVVKQQQSTKQKDEERRADVARQINDKYTAAETKVNTLLEEADKAANEIFETGAEEARLQFENYVDEKMRAYKRRRYSGFWGGLRWAKDKLFGMPDEVNVFYTKGRAMYMAKMDAVITQIANTVTTKLKAAKQAITDGKKEIDDFVMKLPKDLEDVGKEAASNIQDRFDALEQSVNDKREQLIDGLAQKYVDNVKKLDDRITELKEANKGLIAKAIGFLKEVWKVIKNLYELFKTILSRLVSIIGVILDNPGGFFANVGAAFKQGFARFENRLEEHLENGLMIWLGTQVGATGLRIPAKFDISAIFSLALQVMGITPKHIRERAIIIMGVERVAMMETTAGVFQKIMSGNLEAIWDEIQEKFTDFKEMIWEAIKSFIKNAIIKAAFILLLSLLNPVAAFVKACMAIYDFLMTLVRMKDRIIELLDSILSAVTLIASGAVDKAAEAIEMALARSIPVIIGFLAAILHLNTIGDKVRGIILRVQKRVEKVIDWMITKLYGLMRPVIEAAMRAKNKGKEMVEKGKEKALDMGRAAVGGGGTPQERLQNALHDGQSAVNRYAGRKVGRLVLSPLLTAIRLRYGLRSLEVVQRDANWAVRGVINPEGELPTNAQADSDTGIAGEMVNKNFTIGEESHTIRAEITDGRVVIKMASATFADLRMRLEDIDREFSRVASKTEANELRGELSRIFEHLPSIAQRAERITNAAERNTMLLNAIDGLSADLARVCQRFGIRRIIEGSAGYQVPPAHNVTYGGLNADGQASSVSVVLSWKSRGFMRSTNPVANVGGMNIVGGYHRGHLLAASLGGSNSANENFAPMSATTNTSRGGMVLGEDALRNALNANAYPPYIVRYGLRCNYNNSKSDLQSWLVSELGAGAAAANNLYRLARRNENLTAALLLTNIGGTATAALINEKFDQILDQLSRHYMPTSFTMSLTLEQGENLTLPSVGKFNNHQ